MSSINLLFLCTGNSCRSQMAEGWTRHLASELTALGKVIATSAGLEAHGLNPQAVKAMSRYGVDISLQQSVVLDDNMVEAADILISVCSHADQNCPLLPANKRKIYIPFDDPARAAGSEAEISIEFDRVCLQIRDAVKSLLQELLNDRLIEKGGDVFHKQDVEMLSRETCYNGFVTVDVLTLRHRLYRGGWSDNIQRELAVRNPAVGVLLYDPDLDIVVLIRQFRTGLLDHDQSPWVLEIVAGIAGTGEAPVDVVKRETLEEANCTISDLISICEYFNSPGWSNEKIYLFCGRVDSTLVSGIHGLDEEHEDILVVKLPFDSAVQALEMGNINNAMAIIAMQWLQVNRSRLRKDWQLTVQG